jgi:all-trans-retinol dehydrogenase (NAD+)
MMDTRNKVVLITGGASGMGRLEALDFARRGAKVAVWDMNDGALKALEDEVGKGGLTIKGWVCDVTNREMVYRLAKEVEAALGPVDVLINNAGVVSGKKLLNEADEKIVQTINVNLLAYIWTIKAFLPGMIERNSGVLVNMSSAAGLIGVRGLADYCATKFGVYGLNEALRMELRHRAPKVRTLVICPYFTDTGMFKGVKTRFPLLLPILKPEYVARRIVNGVLKGRKQIILPRFVYAIKILRLFPVGFIDLIAEFFGISNAMDEFTGREAQ